MFCVTGNKRQRSQTVPTALWLIGANDSGGHWLLNVHSENHTLCEAHSASLQRFVCSGRYFPLVTHLWWSTILPNLLYTQNTFIFLLVWHDKPIRFQALFFRFRYLIYRYLVGLPAMGIGPSQGLYLHRIAQTKKNWRCTHIPWGIRTPDASSWNNYDRKRCATLYRCAGLLWSPATSRRFHRIRRC
jgi:hypothetical protein